MNFTSTHTISSDVHLDKLSFTVLDALTSESLHFQIPSSGWWCLGGWCASFTWKQPQDGSASEQFSTGKEAQPLTKKASLSEGLVDLILSIFIFQKV